MTDTHADHDHTLLTAIQTLRQELPTVLSPPDTHQLDARLAALFEHGDATVRPRVLMLAVAAISQFPQAHQRLAQLLPPGDAWEEVYRTIGYAPVPGGPLPTEPGPWMVCPVDPSHHRRPLRDSGQHLRCPLHQVDLVPEDQVRP